jgi:hypothetical protein
MTAAAIIDDRDDDAPVSPEIAQLIDTVARYQADNMRLRARVAELEHGSADDEEPLAWKKPIGPE